MQELIRPQRVSGTMDGILAWDETQCHPYVKQECYPPNSRWVFVAYFPNLERKIKVGSCYLHAVGVSVHPFITFPMPHSVFMKIGSILWHLSPSQWRI